MKALHLLLIIFTLSALSLKGQGFAEDKRATNNLSFQLFGPERFGLYYNHYLSDYFSLNTGVGWGTSSHIGFNYYPLKVRKCYYVGGQVCLETDPDLDSFTKNYGSQLGIYIPIGFHAISPKGFTFNCEVGYNFCNEDYSRHFIFAIRFGKTWLKQKK